MSNKQVCQKKTEEKQNQEPNPNVQPLDLWNEALQTLIIRDNDLLPSIMLNSGGVHAAGLYELQISQVCEVWTFVFSQKLPKYRAFKHF